MGLTFEQSFYQIPEEVFLIISPSGIPLAIVEKPDDDQKANELKIILESAGPNILVKILNFDNLILSGYGFLESIDVDRDKYDIY